MASNPYTDMQAQALTAASNNNLNTNVLPGINSGAQAAGQYGGTRQGIAQGVAAGQAQTGLNSAIAGLYANNYATDQNTGLQQQSINNSYNLGLGSLGNQATAQNQNFYTQQRGLDLNQYAVGSQLYNAGVQGNTGIAQGMYTTGQTYQQAPLSAVQQYSNTISPYTGYGQSKSTTGESSTAANVLGGAFAGDALGSKLTNRISNAWNSGGSSNSGANWGSGYSDYMGGDYLKQIGLNN